MAEVKKTERALIAARVRSQNMFIRNLAGGLRSGTFKSLLRGNGIEFCGVRDYLRGDDVRSIDWNVTARMGKPYVKMFNEEREMIVFILIDASLSMTADTVFSRRPSRFETARETAAALILAASCNGSPCGGVLFDSSLLFSAHPRSGREQTMVFLDKLYSAKPSGEGGTALCRALRGAAEMLKKRSLIVVISDFRAAMWQDDLARLALKHDVAAVRITDEYDFELPRTGMLPFIDPESGAEMQLPTSSRSFRKEWRAFNERHIQSWREVCIRRGAAPLVIGTAEDPIAKLVDFFASGRRPPYDRFAD